MILKYFGYSIGFLVLLTVAAAALISIDPLNSAKTTFALGWFTQISSLVLSYFFSKVMWEKLGPGDFAGAKRVLLLTALFFVLPTVAGYTVFTVVVTHSEYPGIGSHC
ncbi:MAG TPA: hypothetical protein V6C97_21080 [Oculatellaceae cyanobacterium]